MKRKPSRRDLLIVIGRLQDLIGRANSLNNDRNPNKQASVDGFLNEAHQLCVEVRSYEPPIETNLGEWGVIPPRRNYI